MLGTAVRDGSLHSAYSRTQTGRFESSAWYPNSGTTTTIEAEQATLNGDWGNMRTWAARMERAIDLD